MTPRGPRRTHDPHCNRDYPIPTVLQHLIEAHCPEGWEPECFVAGPRAYTLTALHQAAEGLGYPLVQCPDPECSNPDHVLLLTRAVSLPGG